MSSTRKKLKRLFKKPSTTASEAFAPRDLDRTPREFDEDGRPIDRSQTQSTTQAPAQPQARPTTQQAPARRPTPSSDRVTTQDSLANAPIPPPPPSKARGDVGAQPPAHHTAPWAAHAAFDSWKQQKKGKKATESNATPRTQAVAPRVEKPSHTASTTAPTIKTNVGSTTEPMIKSSTQSYADQAPRDSTRPVVPAFPPGHVYRVDAAARTKRVSMQATKQFKAWKTRRDQHTSHDGGASRTPEPQSLKDAQSPDAKKRLFNDAQLLDAPIPTKKKLPKDRVRRRAIRSKEAFLPEHARQYELKDVEGANIPHATSPSKAEAGRDVQKPQTVHASKEKKLTMRATIAPTAQTPAERLMWISAHQQELSDEHIVSTLSALEGTALRAGHEARRLRMLSESLLRLERNDDALETLNALQAIVPHDAWTLLRLAETCATRADTMEAGLRWCEDALRLHPWLSQAQTLRDEIEARLQKLN